MWAYLARYPGLVVLHDARLHQARARHLLEQRRFDDYRREFRYDHPDARADFAEYAIQGLGGPIYYFWPMRRVVMDTARVVAVHNPLVAEELRSETPNAIVETIRMGVAPLPAADTNGSEIRRRLGLSQYTFVFVVFGKVTREKRIPQILRSLGALTREGVDASLLVVGAEEDYSGIGDDCMRCGVSDRVRIAGHVQDAEVGSFLSIADACLCLRWPTAQETSASWLRCLAARRATVITDLPHLAIIPRDVALRVDLLDEEASLLTAMRELATDASLCDAVARSGHEYWSAHHTLDHMAADYNRVLISAIGRPAPRATDIPRHFTDDHSEPARLIAHQFGVSVDLLD
jgi:hypothetical protein